MYVLCSLYMSTRRGGNKGAFWRDREKAERTDSGRQQEGDGGSAGLPGARALFKECSSIPQPNWWQSGVIKSADPEAKVPPGFKS